MALEEELERVAAAAAAHAESDEVVTGILPVETASGARVFLCAFESERGRSWLALDGDTGAVASRALVREAVSIAALCEVAEERAGGGDISALLAELARLRDAEGVEGVEEAEDAAVELERVIQPPPRVASSRYLDAIGSASRRLEHALGETMSSPFAAAMQQALGAVDELAADVERTYKVSLA